MPSLFDSQYWSEEEDAMWEDMAEIVILALLAGVESGVALLPANARVLVDFDLVNTDVLEYAKTYRYELIHGITETTRKQTQKAVGDWIQSGQPLSVLEQTLAPIYGEVRAGMIASTEVTRVYAEGNSEAWDSTGVVGSWRWMTSQDDLVCAICGGLDGETFGLDDIDARPPAHPSCRC